MITWPPHYHVKRHAKAKNVIIKASAEKGLTITIPKRYSLKHIPAVLDEHKEWIIAQLAKLPATEKFTLPEDLAIKALNQIWKIQYYPTSGRLELLVKPGNELVMMGDVAQTKKCLSKLIIWLKQIAKIYLTNEIEKISKLTGLTYHSLAIRSQSSIWGSCTVKKAISLNYRLILLPEYLVHYVIIHELCHTVYLHHQPSFWGLVEKFDNNWRQHRREIKSLSYQLPTWL